MCALSSDIDSENAVEDRRFSGRCEWNPSDYNDLRGEDLDFSKLVRIGVGSPTPP